MWMRAPLLRFVPRASKRFDVTARRRAQAETPLALRPAPLTLNRIFLSCCSSNWLPAAVAAVAALRWQQIRFPVRLARPPRQVGWAPWFALWPAPAALAAPTGKAYSRCVARRDRDAHAPRDSRPTRPRHCGKSCASAGANFGTEVFGDGNIGEVDLVAIGQPKAAYVQRVGAAVLAKRGSAHAIAPTAFVRNRNYRARAAAVRSPQPLARRPRAAR